ncbi:MAG TPA: ribosome-associated translation inhibitor RaiA [Granulicella sp.]|jgi:putative sigma-54 modulation protein|nr:ribosome-associated translation inhibitor RaiA [Granulicella sp.]
MEIEYTGRQTTITKKLKTQTEAGLTRIAKLVGRSASAHVFLTTEKYRRIAEVTLKKRGQSLVGTCEATEMTSALHDALSKLEQQAIRYSKKRATEKRHPKARQPGIKLAALDVLSGIELEAAPANGAKLPTKAKKTNGGNGSGRKAVPMVVHSFPAGSSRRPPIAEPHVVRAIDGAAIGPMSLEVAVKEASLRDRDVFVFRDPYGQPMVLHRQRDGRVELIQFP